MESLSSIKLLVRFANEKDVKRDVTLFGLSPNDKMSKVAELLAKECETNASLLKLTLEGQLLSTALTLEQAFGATSFAVALDARVEVEEKKEENKSATPNVRSASQPQVLSPIEAHQNFMYVDLSRVDKDLFCPISREPAVEARVHNVCSTLFDLKFIREALESSSLCPLQRDMSVE